MKKADAESIIRSLATAWARETGFEVDSSQMPSFGEFEEYVRDKSPEALQFRSVMGARHDVECWFDEELKQNWRN